MRHSHSRAALLSPLLCCAAFASSESFSLVEQAAAPFSLASSLAPSEKPDLETQADNAEALADQNSQNQANSPLTPKITINFHDYYAPVLTNLPGKEANQFLFRGLIPHKLFGTPQLFRFTLPLATAPNFPHGSDTGLGDLTLINFFVLPGKKIQIGVGPLFVAPTATVDSLGAGKWQLGAAGVLVAPFDWGLLGGLLTYQHSITGESDRADVSLLTFQPLVLFNLPAGFYLRSTAIWTFNLENGTYYIPIGFGAGKVWDLGKGTTMNTFLEPQYTAFNHGAANPRWQIFAGVNFQFAY